MERDTLSNMVINAKKDFNSRAHVERDEQFKEMFEKAEKFQLTRSRGARLATNAAQVASDKFQLTRSRGARQVPCVCVDELTEISTHALTWSATCCHRLRLRGGRNFNSRAHVERDPIISRLALAI